MNIPYPEETSIGRFLGYPLTKFGYGVYFAIMSLIWWTTDFGNDLPILIQMFSKGLLMMFSCYYIGSYYNDFKEFICKRNLEFPLYIIMSSTAMTYWLHFHKGWFGL